jgi:hypothetical protein
MFERIVSPANFFDAYQKTQRGSPKYKPGAVRFARNETENLEVLRQSVISGEYRPSDYIEFPVFEPKERVIYAPKYKDKIVQHAVNNVLRDFYEPKFIFDSYACIRGKGNQAAVLRLQQFMRAASINYETPWIVKADVQKFFYSIDREVVKGIVRRKVFCRETTDLLFRIVDSSPNKMGLPLGNLTSQLLANVLMNELDHYVKRTLGARYYLRYADDLVILVDGKAQAGDILGCIRSFGRDVLNLTFPDRKCFIRPLRYGLEALGYRITAATISLTSRAKSIFIRRIKAFDRKLLLKLITKNEVIQSLTSWYSYAGNAQCRKFVRDACLKTHQIRFTTNERFIIVRTLQ